MFLAIVLGVAGHRTDSFLIGLELFSHKFDLPQIISLALSSTLASHHHSLHIKAMGNLSYSLISYH